MQATVAVSVAAAVVGAPAWVHQLPQQPQERSGLTGPWGVSRRATAAAAAAAGEVQVRRRQTKATGTMHSLSVHCCCRPQLQSPSFDARAALCLHRQTCSARGASHSEILTPVTAACVHT